MTDLLPCLIPYSERVHAAPLWASPAICRPEGPAPLWYSPLRWDPTAHTACPNCTALAAAAAELAHIDEQVAGW